jgi:hypothetical protein
VIYTRQLQKCETFESEDTFWSKEALAKGHRAPTAIALQNHRIPHMRIGWLVDAKLAKKVKNKK